MKIIGKVIQDSPVSFGFNTLEFTIELDNGKIVYLDMYEDDFNNQIPFEDAECWVYNVPYSEVKDEPNDSDYYECSEKELKQLYIFCLSSEI